MCSGWLLLLLLLSWSGDGDGDVRIKKEKKMGGDGIVIIKASRDDDHYHDCHYRLRHRQDYRRVISHLFEG